MTVHPLMPLATEEQLPEALDCDDIEPATAGARWGGFAMVPKAAVFDSRLTDGEFRKLAAVCAFANRNGDCFPSLERIARQFGLTRRAKRQRGKALRSYLTRQAIQSGLRKARALGYLRVESQTRKNGAWRPNLYRILFPPLSPPVAAQERGNGDGRRGVDTP